MQVAKPLNFLKPKPDVFAALDVQRSISGKPLDRPTGFVSGLTVPALIKGSHINTTLPFAAPLLALIFNLFGIHKANSFPF
jgi:hypothetical protein